MSSYGIWLSAAGMKVQQHRQTVIANNMANAHTTGFKQDLVVVEQRRVESRSSPDGFRFAHPILDGMAGGLNVRPTHHNFAQGSIESTGRPLDVAIQGEGFFSVTDGTSTRYTRDGQFAINRDGGLVLTVADGRWKVLDDAGAPIVIDQSAGEITLSQNGTVRQGRAVVAKLGLMTTADKQSLTKVGETLFDAGDAEMTPIESRLVTRSREKSNVNVMRGLVSMIEAARAYQLNSTMIQLQDHMTGQAVSAVGRVA